VSELLHRARPSDEVGLPACPCGNRASIAEIAGFHVWTCDDGAEHWFYFDRTENMWIEEPSPFLAPKSGGQGYGQPDR